MQFILFIVFMINSCFSEISENAIQRAQINISYLSSNGEYILEHGIGWYGVESKIDNAKGRLILSLTSDNKTDGCSRIMNIVPETWIALIKRNSCKFHDKIFNAAILNNASAVIIYNSENSSAGVAMKHQIKDVVAIFVSFNFGYMVSTLLLNNSTIYVTITPEGWSDWEPPMGHHWLTSRTSVLFVSISFIVLIAVSLCWLAIYYVQRFRYVSSKHVSKRLMNAAWRAVQAMEQKSIRNGDAELTGDTNVCAICVENYKVADSIRILPCKHKFHKSCVDIWLLEQRRCPLCQLNILQNSQNRKKNLRSSHTPENPPTDVCRLPLVLNETDNLRMDETAEHSATHWLMNNDDSRQHSNWSKISNAEESEFSEEDNDWTENSNIEFKNFDLSTPKIDIKERAKILKSNWLSEINKSSKHNLINGINADVHRNKIYRNNDVGFSKNNVNSQNVKTINIIQNNIKFYNPKFNANDYQAYNENTEALIIYGNTGNKNNEKNKIKKKYSSEIESFYDYSPTCSSINSKRKISDFSGNSDF